MADWNLQNVLCETLSCVGEQCRLNADILQVVCEYACGTKFCYWKKHAMVIDEFVMDYLVEEEREEIIAEFLIFDAFVFKEFASQICEETERKYWDRYKWDKEQFPPITVFEWQSYEDWKGFVEYWLKRGIDMSQKESEYPLMRACAGGGNWISIFDKVFMEIEWSDNDMGMGLHVREGIIPYDLMRKSVNVVSIKT